MGTLYVVATPIGNLEDLTRRAVRVLGEVPVVAAEDTRRTRELLSHLGAHPKLVSFHEHSTEKRTAEMLDLLDRGDVALVTDAGSPGIADPGPRLVTAARLAGHAVVPVPGPSAVSTALSVAGLPADSYVFVGFLPRKASDRRQRLTELATERRTIVAFETPQRLVGALEDISAAFGSERTVVVTRELTKRFEEIWSGAVADALAHWQETEPRGEFTLVLAGAEDAASNRAWTDDEVRQTLATFKADGVGAREASRQVAARASRSAREVYSLWDHGQKA